MTAKHDVAAQYRTAQPLKDRCSLYAFSTGSIAWHERLFGQIHLHPSCRILDIGCGPATPWAGRARRLPPEARLTFADLSEAMIAEAQARLHSDERFDFLLADLESLPFADAQFDVVTALHVVNHADSAVGAIEQLRRVLKPDGRCSVSTPSVSRLSELRALLLEYDAYLIFPAGRMLGLLSEDAPTLLRGSFGSVEGRTFSDQLVIDSPAAIVRYYLSIFDGNGYPDLGGRASDPTRFVEKAIADRGPLRTESRAGLFVCAA